jgi:hypothetical protein
VLENVREGREERMDFGGGEERVLLAWRAGRVGCESEGSRNLRSSGSAIVSEYVGGGWWAIDDLRWLGAGVRYQKFSGFYVSRDYILSLNPRIRLLAPQLRPIQDG